MYLCVASIKYPQQGYKHLYLVSPIRHLDWLAAICNAVLDWWGRNNSPFNGIYDSDFWAAVQDVPNDVCAAHGFFIVKDRHYHNLEAEQEPNYNKIHII